MRTGRVQGKKRGASASQGRSNYFVIQFVGDVYAKVSSTSQEDQGRCGIDKQGVGGGVGGKARGEEGKYKKGTIKRKGGNGKGRKGKGEKP